jgi:hypothetical protein
MAKLTQLLKENIDQRKRKVYLKAVIDMATAYSRRGYTQDEAIKDAAKGIENVYGYVLTPQDIEAVRHFVPENPQFKEIVVKPTDPTKKLKQALVDAMYDDCWNFSDGDFDDWFENGFDSGDSPEVEEAYFALQEVAPKEAPDFYYDEAPYIVEKMLKDEN